MNPPSASDFADKAAGRARTEELRLELDDLHDRLWAEARRGVVLVLQGMDASGKDGTIRQVLTGLNPQGCSVTNFKAPTTTDLAHDYLWRVHAAMPARGILGVWNRSHYEDVVTARCHRRRSTTTSAGVRYRHIREFERHARRRGHHRW